jgi:ATP-dependent RNA helicase RhlE
LNIRRWRQPSRFVPTGRATFVNPRRLCNKNFVPFSKLGLSPKVVEGVRAAGYAEPTAIQLRAIPLILEGRDLIGSAQTGTGKTAAFALPLISRLGQRGRLRALVLEPTRELAAQVETAIRDYGRFTDLRTVVLYGGTGYGKQDQALRQGADIVVATPGRLLDQLQRRMLRLDQIEVLVLDEADRMLDMGFIHDIRKVIAKLPVKRQTLLFSATMPKDIAELANQMLRDPARVAVTPVASTVDRIAQRIIQVDHANKTALLAQLLKQEPVNRALIFTRTKHGADKVVKSLAKSGIRSDAIHGNKSQNHRERVLAAFRTGEIRTLVATDIAARGIDVDGISHVVNFDLPNVPETYVHRIGRTARAGTEGAAISLVAGAEEMAYLRDIEKLIRVVLPREDRRTPGQRETASAHPQHRSGRPAPHGHATRVGEAH